MQLRGEEEWRRWSWTDRQPRVPISTRHICVLFVRCVSCVAVLVIHKNMNTYLYASPAHMNLRVGERDYRGGGKRIRRRILIVLASGEVHIVFIVIEFFSLIKGILLWFCFHCYCYCLGSNTLYIYIIYTV